MKTNSYWVRCGVSGLIRLGVPVCGESSIKQFTTRERQTRSRLRHDVLPSTSVGQGPGTSTIFLWYSVTAVMASWLFGRCGRGKILPRLASPLTTFGVATGGARSRTSASPASSGVSLFMVLSSLSLSPISPPGLPQLDRKCSPQTPRWLKASSTYESGHLR